MLGQWNKIKGLKGLRCLQRLNHCGRLRWLQYHPSQYKRFININALWLNESVDTDLTNVARAFKQMTWNHLKKKNCITHLKPGDAFDQAYGTLYYNKSGFHDLLNLNNGALWAFHKSQIGQWPQSPTLHKSTSTKLELQNTYKIANMSKMFASMKETEHRSNRQGSHVH